MSVCIDCSLRGKCRKHPIGTKFCDRGCGTVLNAAIAANRCSDCEARSFAVLRGTEVPSETLMKVEGSSLGPMKPGRNRLFVIWREGRSPQGARRARVLAGGTGTEDIPTGSVVWLAKSMRVDLSDGSVAIVSADDVVSIELVEDAAG